jgi:hypothetical protein
VLAITIGTGLASGGVAYYAKKNMDEFRHEVDELRIRHEDTMTLMKSQMDLLSESTNTTFRVINQTENIRDQVGRVWNSSLVHWKDVNTEVEMAVNVRLADSVSRRLLDLLDLLVDLKLGSNHSGLVPQLLDILEITDINSILISARKSLKVHQTFPNYNFLSELVMAPSMRCDGEALLISFQIPVVDEDRMRLVKPIILPVISHNHLLWVDTTSPDLLIVGDVVHRKPSSCIFIGGTEACVDTFLPYLDPPACLAALWNSSIDSSCRFQQSPLCNTFIPLTPDDLLFVLPEPYDFPTATGTLRINGTGIMHLKEPLQESFALSSITTSFGVLHVPLLNLTSNIDNLHLNWTTSLHEETRLLASHVMELRTKVRDIDLRHFSLRTPEWGWSMLLGGPYVFIFVAIGLLYCRLNRVILSAQSPHREFFKDVK